MRTHARTHARTHTHSRADTPPHTPSHTLNKVIKDLGVTAQREHFFYKALKQPYQPQSNGVITNKHLRDRVKMKDIITSARSHPD